MPSFYSEAQDRSRQISLISLITHELRSPLNSINGYLDLTLEGLGGELTESQREFIQRARAGSEHLYTLLEDFLLAMRADAGQLRLQRSPVELAELLYDVRESLTLAASDAQVSLDVVIPIDFPIVSVDEVRLQQIVRNLLVNAIRSTPVGGQVVLGVRICAVSLHLDKELIEISVRDTGIGIAAEYHERIFERFFQVPLVSGGRGGGLGLGLAMVKLLVELHGGSVRVESQPGEGSTFIVTLDTF